MKFKKNALLASMFSVAVASSAMAGEFPIGDPVEKKRYGDCSGISTTCHDVPDASRYGRSN